MNTVILITGANRGIGFGIAQAIAARIPPSTILIGCRSLAAGQQAIDSLASTGMGGSKLEAIVIDIDDDASIASAARTVDERYGKLDVLINNAASVGFPQSKELGDLRRNSNQVYNNCITSNAIVTTAFIPLLRKSSFPRVIMNSSARGSLGRTAAKQLPPVALVDYCVAKAGLNMLTLQLQQQEEGVGPEVENRITYWVVSPGHTKTGFNNFRGHKDPVDSAEVFIRLLEAKKEDVMPGTFWEFEEGEFRSVPW